MWFCNYSDGVGILKRKDRQTKNLYADTIQTILFCIIPDKYGKKVSMQSNKPNIKF